MTDKDMDQTQNQDMTEQMDVQKTIMVPIDPLFKIYLSWNMSLIL